MCKARIPRVFLGSVSLLVKKERILGIFGDCFLKWLIIAIFAPGG